MHKLTELIAGIISSQYGTVEEADKLITDYLRQRAELLQKELLFMHKFEREFLYGKIDQAFELSVGEKCGHRTTVSSSEHPGKIFCQICGKDITPVSPKLPRYLEPLEAEKNFYFASDRLNEMWDKINEILTYLAEKQ